MPAGIKGGAVLRIAGLLAMGCGGSTSLLPNGPDASDQGETGATADGREGQVTDDVAQVPDDTGQEATNASGQTSDADDEGEAGMVAPGDDGSSDGPEAGADAEAGESLTDVAVSDSESSESGCADAGPCVPNGNPCKQGALACSSGVLLCAVVGNLPDGTSCGAGAVCFAGQCADCVAGSPCSPAGDPCHTGVTSCSTGRPICASTSSVADGTACTGGMCCGGQCAMCNTPDHAAAACRGSTCDFVCGAGRSACAHTCADTTSDSQACGPTCAVCPLGSMCVASQCTPVFKYGDFTPYTPCQMNGAQTFTANYLLGERVYVDTAIQLTALGVIASPAEPTSGVDGILALYTDSGGLPVSLVARTATATIAPGNSLLPVEMPVALPVGNYWIMGEYDATPSICVDNSSSNPAAYIKLGGYGSVPPTLSNVQALSGIDFNYYVVGTQ